MDSIQDQALKRVMWTVGHTNNEVNRYISDAVAEYDLLKNEIAALRAEIEQIEHFDAVDLKLWQREREAARAALEGGQQ